ncbi:hypothetical protein ABPG75_006905 [Micractinium tetrahymenae]
MLLHVAAVVLGLAVAARADGVDVGPITVNPVKVLDPDEITHKWWFWLIIGLIGLFLIVGAYFTWRGFKQWKLHKQREEAYEAAAEEREKQEAAKSVSDGQERDVEMGRVTASHLPLVPASAGVPSQPLSPGEARWAALQQDPAWLAEKERRTAVHPGRHRW